MIRALALSWVTGWELVEVSQSSSGPASTPHVTVPPACPPQNPSMAPLLRLAAALLLTPPASPHSRAPPPEQGQQAIATVDVGNLRYFTWYECCTDTNANLTLGPNLTKNPGSESSPPDVTFFTDGHDTPLLADTQSQEGGFRGDEPALNLGKSSYTERIEGAFNQFGVPSLFGPIAGESMGIFAWPQCNKTVPQKCYPPGGWGKSVGRLKVGWEAAVANIATTIRPLVATGAVVGIWFGAPPTLLLLLQSSPSVSLCC